MNVTVKTWDEVWERGRAANCTHWNYSRGKVRFRPILEEPLEIGEEIILESPDRIRVRFYTIVEDEYVDNEDSDVWLKTSSESTLEVPENFEEWDTDKQRQFMNVALERVSAGRFSHQMQSADKLLFRFIDFLTKSLQQKEKLITDLQKEVNRLNSTKGIGNVYEFLVHPNAMGIVQTLATLLASGKAPAADVLQEIKRIATSPEQGLTVDPIDG